jgi:L-asparaginase II
MNLEFHDAGKSSADLLHVHRGGLIESIHRGTVVVMEGDEVVFSAGDPGLVTYYRSTAKLFQALPLVTSGAVERFGLEPRALALAAGSHSAAPEHLAVAREMLRKAGLSESDLRCGGHWSINGCQGRHQAVEIGPDAKELPAIWSNCSGKHAGMLASARAMDAPAAGYLDPSHPIQVEICRVIGQFCGLDPNEITLGIDGCGAPVHGVSMEQMAVSLVRFGDPELVKDAALADAARRVGAAISAHPLMLAGEKRFDTDLMQSAATRLLSKAGAEGVHGVAVPGRRLGIAVKVDDGKDRGNRLVVIELLRRFGVLSEAEAEGLAERHGRTIRNFAGADVGRLEVVV